MNRRFFLGLLLLLPALGHAADTGTFEIHLASDREAPGLKEYPYLEGMKARPIFLNPKVLLDSTALQHAEVVEEQKGISILIKLTPAGGEKFKKITAENVGQTLALVFSGKVVSAPRVLTEIGGGTVSLSGSFTKEEAADLAARLNAQVVK